MDQNFFGFRPEHRPEMHDNLFNLLWYGEGRWDWDTIYNMPVHIRRHWIKRVNDIIQSKMPDANEKKKKKPKT